MTTDPGGGRPRMTLRAAPPRGTGTLVPRVLGSEAAASRVALVASGALLRAGDRVALEVHVGAGAHLELVEPAGTVAYDMRGGSAGWDVVARVEHGGTLVWRSEPFVVAHGADVRRRTSISLAESASLLLSETLVLGRAGEDPGSLSARTSIEISGRPTLVEELVTGPGAPRVGILGDHRVMETVLCVGRGHRSLATLAAGVEYFELAHGGSMLRSIADAAHEASLARAWQAVMAA